MPQLWEKPDCPPYAPMFDKVFDVNQTIYAIYSIYNLGNHVEKMREKHPLWTETQLYNVLYWQGSARKVLKSNIAAFVSRYRESGYYVTTSPEAMGVDVTQTLLNAGIKMEWPARNNVYKVAMAGIPLTDEYRSILR